MPGLYISIFSVSSSCQYRGYGISTFPNTKVTPSTLFYAGSTTKAFIASALSLLIDNSTSYSNIAWNTPISTLIPADFVLEDTYATAHVTIEDALSHRSGMPRHDASYGGEGETIRSLTRSLRWLNSTAQPRARWQYCNMMYVVLSYVLETLTGVWVGDFLRERIWEPLEMRSTVSRLNFL